MVAGRRGRRGRRAVLTADIIDVELVTTQHLNIMDDTVRALISTLATAPADSVEVFTALCIVQMLPVEFICAMLPESCLAYCYSVSKSV